MVIDNGLVRGFLVYYLPVLAVSRLYWCSVVTVLLPGLCYLEVSVDYLCKSTSWVVAVSALSTPIGGNGTIPLLTLTLTTISSVQHKNTSLTSTPPRHLHANIMYR
jgi:hypothetical protein